MKKTLCILFSILMSLTTAAQTMRFGKTEPHFSDLPEVRKQPIRTREFAFGAHDLVVSPDGDDSAVGSPDAPLQTIAEAKRRLSAQRGVSDGSVVWLHGGTYPIRETLRFDKNDPTGVTYCAYPGEEVCLSGGSAIRGGWETTQVNGVSAWVRPVDSLFSALYGEDGQAVRRTRYPESGYLYVKDTCLDGALYTEENTPWKDYMLGECAFVADSGDLRGLPEYRNPQDILVRLFHYWKDEMLPLKSYDAQTGIVTSTKYCSMSPHKGDRYFLENVFEALNEPGEWYLDRARKLLYYIPLPGQTPENTTLYSADTEKLLTLDGANGVAFEGITFCNTGWHPLLPKELNDFHPGLEHPQAAYSTPACITVRNAQDVTFDACTFRNIGFSALRLGDNVQDAKVTRSHFCGIGGNAVYISGQAVDNERTSERISVTDCLIERYGRSWANAIGVFSTHARTLTIAHNEIRDGYYTAISVGWNWGYSENIPRDNRICDNLIYDIGQGWLSDMGGIYTLGVQPGTVISGNVIHDVAADPGVGGYGGWGIYLDEGSSFILVEKNLVYACASQGFHQHYGRENVVRNNIIAGNEMGQLRISRVEEHVSAVFERNIVVGFDRAMFVNVKTQKWLEDGNLYWDTVRGEWVRSARRVEDGGTDFWPDLWSRARMRLRGHYTNAVFADPWFHDVQNHDFTLADNSPALRCGFEPWDTRTAGTVSDFTGRA
ncbi:MAG: right-handed parallel beta-helix repeat-containing protein [Clostridia bacterium]|nr:right-handed parallel beta-helix repeat-containing protein [Clostridia bacterium]